MIQTIISDGKAEFDYLQALKARQQETNADVTRAVQDILDDVRREGDAAVTRYSAKFDHAEGPIRVIEAAEIADAKSRIDAELLGAMERAAVNIRRFHQQQVQESYVAARTPSLFSSTRSVKRSASSMAILKRPPAVARSNSIPACVSRCAAAKPSKKATTSSATAPR